MCSARVFLPFGYILDQGILDLDSGEGQKLGLEQKDALAKLETQPMPTDEDWSFAEGFIGQVRRNSVYKCL